MKKEDIKKIFDFLSDNGVSLISTGCYGFSKDKATDACYEFLLNGSSNIIKEDQDLTFGNWDLINIIKNKTYDYITDSKYWIKLQKLKIKYNDFDNLKELEEIIEFLLKKESIRKTYKYKRKLGFTQLLRKQCLDRDKKCIKCGSIEKLEVDHKIELIDGGDNLLDNLQTLCRVCHSKKTKLSIKKRKNGKN